MATIHQPRRIVDLVLESTIDEEQAVTLLTPRHDGHRPWQVSGRPRRHPEILPFEDSDELELKEPEP
jgi:hypothetical protein